MKLKKIYDKKFKEYFKQVTIDFQKIVDQKNKGDSNTSPISSIKEIFLKHNANLSPNTPKFITKSTVHMYVENNLVGQSPIRKGLPSKIHIVFEKLITFLNLNIE